MIIDLYADDNVAMRHRLVNVVILRKKKGDRDEFEDAVEFDPSDGKFYQTVWKDSVSYGGMVSHRTYVATETASQPEYVKALYNTITAKEKVS